MREEEDGCCLDQDKSLGLGWEGKGDMGMGRWGRNNIHLDPFLPLPTFLRDQHTQYHSIPHPMGSLLLGWEDWRSLSPTCSCR